eukprot:SAG11_NODE_6129_length_1382_cov_1.990647_1_plen_136_part_00
MYWSGITPKFPATVTASIKSTIHRVLTGISLNLYTTRAVSGIFRSRSMWSEAFRDWPHGINALVADAHRYLGRAAAALLPNGLLAPLPCNCRMLNLLDLDHESQYYPIRSYGTAVSHDKISDACTHSHRHVAACA